MTGSFFVRFMLFWHIILCGCDRAGRETCPLIIAEGNFDVSYLTATPLNKKN